MALPIFTGSDSCGGVGNASRFSGSIVSGSHTSLFNGKEGGAEEDEDFCDVMCRPNGNVVVPLSRAFGIGDMVALRKPHTPVLAQASVVTEIAGEKIKMLSCDGRRRQFPMQCLRVVEAPLNKS